MDNEYHNLGNVLQESGKFDEAVIAYQNAIVQNPNFSWSYHSLGDVLLKLEQWEEAAVAYRKAVELNPNFSWSYHNLGDALLKLKQWEEAAAAYRCEIALKSDFAWSFCNLGDALTKLEQWNEAINAYLKAILIDRDLPGIYEKLGYVLRQIESEFKQVILPGNLQITPENREFYLDLGRSLARDDRLESAIKFYELLLTLEPSCEIYSVELEALLKQKKKFDRTLALCLDAVAQQPDDCWSYYNLGVVLSSQNKWEEATVAFFKAMEINPDLSWWFYYNLWEVLVKQDKLDEVASFYRSVAEAQPAAFWPYLNLGEALTRQGKIEEAICCYQTVSYQQTLGIIVSKNTGKMPVLQNTVKIPNFIIIGSQRCGTTSLYTYLAQHPQILTPIKKEMDFFSWHFHRGIDWYLAHFPPIPQGENFFTFEASPSYFDYREAPERLYSAFPQVKLIVLLRNPVDRAISHFYRLSSLNWEHRSFDRAISDEVERLNQNPEYIIGGEPGNYLARGRYVEFIENWLALFPRKQLLILKSEDFYAGAAETVQQVLEFLDLPDYQLSEYQNANPGYYQQVNQSVRHWLSDYFKPYNLELEEYLGRKFDWE
ncbi:MAG: tetratricopeptide repeat protein [Microcoleus sp. CSU_2_2]|nr:tetratricopeptide repeat protein [Microcoleus sp. SU_5_3]NJS11341.1 tetratricopeptide repeat protein [Microcoleus sp. CSU_2_2]